VGPTSLVIQHGSLPSYQLVFSYVISCYGIFQPRPVFAIMFIKLCFQFYVCLCIPLTLMWSVVFLCLTSCLNYAILLHADLLEVPVTYLGSFGYFPAWGPVLPDGRPGRP
jgi:hypothetical protein